MSIRSPNGISIRAMDTRKHDATKAATSASLTQLLAAMNGYSTEHPPRAQKHDQPIPSVDSRRR
jgi:hypothetical protein